MRVAALVVLALLLCRGTAADDDEAAAGGKRGPRFCIYNQVHFHLEVVAGAAHVLKQLTPEPVHIYLPEKVIKNNWYGFMSFMGNMDGIELKDSDQYDGVTTYDLVWFISPEFRQPNQRLTIEQHTRAMREMIDQMKPKVLMYMVHNGHMPQREWDKVKSLASTEVPVLTLAPHVSNSIGNRSLPVPPDWILPIFPFEPPNPCSLEDLNAGRHCIKGFSVQGRIEKSRRNYTEVWEQIGGHRRHHTASAVANFKLNILGELVEAFNVPVEVRDLVAVYKNPPYPIFYDVVSHSYALVPMLASPLYYKSKFSSTVLTSLITGVPMIADRLLLGAYTMIDRDAVFYQDDASTELDVMFKVTRMDPNEMWRTRAAVSALRDRMNDRAKRMISGWLTDKGVTVVPSPPPRPRKLSRRKLPEGDEAEGGGKAAAGAGAKGAKGAKPAKGAKGEKGSSGSGGGGGGGGGAVKVSKAAPKPRRRLAAAGLVEARRHALAAAKQQQQQQQQQAAEQQQKRQQQQAEQQQGAGRSAWALARAAGARLQSQARRWLVDGLAPAPARR